MDPAKVTVRDLFALPVQYVVPRFQRGYVWNRDIQWEPLWQDITDAANDLMERSGNNGDQLKAMAEMSPHFMGAVVLKQKQTFPGKPMARIIVDGQQRLTTLQIVMIALAESLVELSSEVDTDASAALEQSATTVRTLTINQGMANEDKYKVLPFDDDFSAFARLVDGAESNGDFHVMTACFEYFKHSIKAWLQGGAKGVETKSEALIITIFDLIMIFSLNLAYQEDEYVIFETLNARAEPLTEWDKAKNHFISKSGETGRSENEFYDEFIDEFDSDPWWKQDAQQPRFQGDRAGLFFNHWLEIMLSENVPARRAYHRFRQYVRNEQDVLGIAMSFKSYASIFKKIENQPQDSSVQGSFRYRRGVLRAGVISPLMMKLHDLLGPGKSLDDCTRIIESYLVRRQIRGWSTRGYDALFLSLLQQVIQTKDANTVAAVLIDSLEQSGYAWPSDAVLRDAVLNAPVYPGVSQARLRMILEAVEDALIHKFAGHQKAPRGLWIEHIMPQQWSTHWPLPDTTEDSAEAARERAIATLGNLTLTNSKLDISLSNLPWCDKQEKIRQHDNLFLNKDLLDNAPKDNWDEDTIRERGERLANIIIQIWPHGDVLKQESG